MIKKFFNNQILNSSPINSITSAAFVIALSGVASKVLGLFRDRILASQFGAGDLLDAYYAAFRIPDLVYNILILGALSAALIPVFTGLVGKGEEKKAWQMIARLVNLAAVSIVVVSAVLIFFAPVLMKMLAPGFSDQKLELSIMFTRIMFLSPLLLGISGIIGGVLNSLKKFIIYSLAPIVYNIGIIIGATLLVRYMGPQGLAWGVVLGAFLHLLIQIPVFVNSGFSPKLLLEGIRFDEQLRKVVKLMIPRTFSIAVNQVSLLVITFFASTLAAGSLAIFNFAQNLQSVPLSVFGISFAVAALPALSHFAARDEWDNFVASFSKVFRHILFFVVPLSVLILILRAQIVRVVLGAGKFDWEDTELTLQALGFFVLSLFAQSLIPLLNRAFYALHDTKTPFFIALGAEIANILAIVMLISKFEVSGLALAFSIASFLQMSLLLFMLRVRLPSLDDGNIIKAVLKISLASLFGGFAAQAVKYAVGYSINLDTFLGVFIQLMAAGLAGIIVFVFFAFIFKMDELKSVKDSITRKFTQPKNILSEKPVEEEV